MMSPMTFSGFNTVNNMNNPLYTFTTPMLQGSTTPNPNMTTNMNYMGSPISFFKPVGEYPPWWANPQNMQQAPNTLANVKNIPKHVVQPHHYAVSNIGTALENVFTDISKSLQSILLAVKH